MLFTAEFMAYSGEIASETLKLQLAKKRTMRGNKNDR